MQTALSWAGCVANDAQTIADAAVQLYQDEKNWQLARELGQINAQLLFEQGQHFTALSTCLMQLLVNLNQHRQNNFMGSMLNHHHHKSTKYMSQWIEEKNRK